MKVYHADPAPLVKLALFQCEGGSTVGKTVLQRERSAIKEFDWCEREEFEA